MAQIQLSDLTPDVIARFWLNVRTGDGCWEWIGPRNTAGYGQLSFGQRPERAHRLAFAMMVGPVPLGLMVRHSCDNRLCVRPDHLVLGTAKDNYQDMVDRGRGNHWKKLTDAQIIELRQMYADRALSVYDIAQHFGIADSSVSAIARGKSRADIPGAMPGRRYAYRRRPVARVAA